jgi:hypothetical protein
MWCNEVRLSANPDKTELIVFTRRRKLPGFFEPCFFLGGYCKSLSVSQVSQGNPEFSADLEKVCGCYGEEG